MFYNLFILMAYTSAEAFDMLMVLGECFQNFTAAAALYAERFPERHHYSRKAFRSLADRVRETGSVHFDHNKGKEITRSVRSEVSADILAAAQQNPHDSTRRIAADSRSSHMTVWRILHEHKMHPYKISLHQELSEDDYLHRINFCMWAQERTNEDAKFFSYVLWSDEATFRSNGEVNRHNMHYWSNDNPHWMREVDNQRYWTLNTWCGIIGNRIIGPHFFEGNLNGHAYNDFLNNALPNLLMDLPNLVRQRMWLQQDGAPPHYAVDVRITLNQRFPDKWIGRGAPVGYPARSPDLTCLDYYLWGRLKCMVYATRPTTREDMMERIRNAIASISPEEIQRSVDSFSGRVELCIANDGKQFEHL